MNPKTETTSVPAPNRPAGAGLRVELVALTLARTVLNTSHRMIYPFLPTIARGLNVTESAVALTVTARSSLGLIGPVIGSLADRRGRKVAMIAAMLIFAFGLGLVGLWPTYPALFAGVLLAGVSKLLFDPALHAYLGDRVDYARRGLAIALAEISWSAAFLVGMPVVAWLIARSDHWYATFPWLAALGAIFAVVLWRVLPADEPFPIDRPSLLDGARTVLAHRSARAGLGVSLLITAANETVAIMFGVWLEDAFAMKIAALGLASVVIGVAELGGEGAVAGLADRLGKRRAVALGIGMNAAASLLLPVLGTTREGALVGLFLFFITFEFAIVSSIPLMTELVPSARATLMAGNTAITSLGRMAGTLIGPPLLGVGILASGATAALIDLAALALLLAFVKQE